MALVYTDVAWMLPHELRGSLLMVIASREFATPFAPSQSSRLPGCAPLQPEAAESLLVELRQNRWRRLRAEYDDPLGMLFNNQARQWTMGWNENQDELYLLVWETESWQNQATWSLYCNGELLYQEADGGSKRRSALCQELLESPLLPCVSALELLSPLMDFRYFEPQREAAAQKFILALLARPEVFSTLKAPLLEALNAELGSLDWPVLDILKLHRVAHKLTLLRVFDVGLKQGWIRQPKDLRQFNQSLDSLERAMDTLQGQLSLLFQPGLAQARHTFSQIRGQRHWEGCFDALETRGRVAG